MTPLMRYRATLTQYLIEQRRLHPDATGEFNDLILAVAQACKAISRAVAHGTLTGVDARLDTINVQGEEQKALDVIANEAFLSGFAEKAALGRHDVSSVRYAVCGSAEVPDELLEEFRRVFGAPIAESYGLTEGGPVPITNTR